MLAHKQYQQRLHDRVGVVVHWVMCKRYGFSTGPKWYEHTPEKVHSLDSTKILWDFSKQTDHKLEHSKPDIIIADKETGEYHLVDIAYSFETRLKENKRKSCNTKN